MLRIDVAGNPPNGYTHPGRQPRLHDGHPPITNALPEIWSFGLRNPWRYSFDDVGPGATGALVIGDVGQGAREEIDYEPAGRGGRNYGWSIVRGRGSTTRRLAGRTPALPAGDRAGLRVHPRGPAR